MPNIRNIIIFLGLAAVFVSIYIFFIQKSGPDSNLVSLPSNTLVQNTASVSGGTQNVIAQNFLSLLLNIKNIKLDDSIFSDPAFQNLHDSSIILVPDVNLGRPNPFAQFGSDSSLNTTNTQNSTNTISPASTTPATQDTDKSTLVTPPATPGSSTTPANPLTPGTIKP